MYTLPTSGHTRYIIDAPKLIRDAPAFPHRGFMLDTSRAFFPVKGAPSSYIECFCRALTERPRRYPAHARRYELGETQRLPLVRARPPNLPHALTDRLNRRHATDSQSWPLSVPAIPELSKHGAYSPEQGYSEADIAFIQEYAGALGITIMMEVCSAGLLSRPGC